MQLIWTLIYGELSLLQRFFSLRHEVSQILAVKYVCLHRISGVIAVIIVVAISVGGRAILLRTAGSLCPLIPPFGKSNLPKKSDSFLAATAPEEASLLLPASTVPNLNCTIDFSHMFPPCAGNNIFKEQEISSDSTTKFPNGIPMTSGPSAGGPPVSQSFSDMHQVLYGQVINSSAPFTFLGEPRARKPHSTSVFAATAASIPRRHRCAPQPQWSCNTPTRRRTSPAACSGKGLRT